MRIGMPANGLDSVLKQINQELVGALDAKSKQDKDRFICRAIGLTQAAYRLTMVTEEIEGAQYTVAEDN